MKHDKQVEILTELMRQIDAKVNIDAGVRYRMPTASYHDPDIAARESESTQRSVASGLLPEILFVRNEPALHHYHRTFADALQMAGPQRVD